jgi:outer membrane protein OmpA-like peptidoglycan-associated protein
MILSLLLLAPGAANAGELGAGLYVGDWALPASSALPPDLMFGGRLRYRWSDDLGVEVSAGKASSGIDPRAELLAFFPNSSRVTPFAALGAGALVTDDTAMVLADLGGGIDAELVPWLDFRTDIRLRVLGEEAPTTALLFNAGLQVHSLRIHDADGDGIADRQDACKNVAEDVDSFEDADGCPEADNDADGIADSADECPLKAEDADGFKDRDGCPEADNDDDGIADADDQCPLDAEDKDSFQDKDGCPDKDNDSDGIADADDKCPIEPETLNGFRDKDGCADEVPQDVQKFSGVIDGVNFESGKAVLLPSSRSVLDSAAAVLVKFPDIRLEVQGHTDDQGGQER